MTTDTEANQAGPPAGAVPDPKDVASLVQYIFGALSAHTLGAAARLGVVETIGDGVATVEEVAAGCATDREATLRLLRAMAGLGLVEETTLFKVTPAGQMLDSSRPGSLSSLAKAFTEPSMVRSLESLDDAVRTGEAVFPKVFGQDYFDYLEKQPEEAASFNAAMGESSAATAAMVAEGFDFGGFGTVVDLGGGDGTLLAAVLQRYPEVRGVVQDLPGALVQTPQNMRDAGVQERFTAAPDDFFVSIAEGDLYVLKGVLHNWDDEHCLKLLRNVRESVPEKGRLLIVENVLPPHVAPELVGSYLNDLNMLVNFGGKERTAADFAALLRQADFAHPVVEQLPAFGVSLIHAAPAPQ
ncbi:methyltransferase [Streptomyces sp. NPDC058045]|uniref:methyltransferase n=1 Tax=Streptomyces sp. NPDC058045 TaxID=3346311 RepID=UPI0036E157E5